MSRYNNQGHPNPAPSDEIDLREVFKAIGSFFSRIGRGIINFILAIRRATKRHKVLILASVAVFVGLGFYWNTNNKEYFTSSLVIESEYFTPTLMDEAIGTLNSLAEEEAYGALVQKLKLSEKGAKNLRSFKVEGLISEDDQMVLDAYMQALEAGEITPEELLTLKDKLVSDNSKYRITVEVFSTELLGNLQRGIIEYLEGNEYVNRRITVKEENLRALQGKLQQEREKLDALKALIAKVYTRMGENERNGSNNVIFGAAESATDPLNVFREDIKLYNEELDIRRSLALMDNIEVISEFTAFTKPANRPLVVVLLLSGLVGLAAAYSIILLLEGKKALDRYEQVRSVKQQNQLA